MNIAHAAAALSPGYDPYAGHADTGSIFSKIGHAVSKAAKGIGKGIARGAHDAIHPKDLAKDSFSIAKYSYKNIVKPVVKTAVPIITPILKKAGPWGMVASGALNAMKAGLSGKNLESIAWAAAEGAAPDGIDRAITAAEKIRHGGNVLTVAIEQAKAQFTPGSPEHLGFQTAIDVLKQTASKAALGVARRALPSEGSKRAFDAAMGTISQAVQTNGMTLRPGIPNINLSRVRGQISAMQPNLKGAIQAIQRNPSLASLHPMVLAHQLGVTQMGAIDALKHVGTQHLLPWRSLTPNATRFIRKWHPSVPIRALTHGTADTAGLDQTGTKYIVTKGDSPWSIAQKLTGNGANWTALKALNADKKPPITQNVWVGEILNIPPSWQKPSSNAPTTPVALPSQPGPLPPVITSPAAAPQISITPSILQAKGILVAWSKTDGQNQAGLTDYGNNVADLSTSMGPRDTLVLAAFQNWDNRTLSAGLQTSGQLDAATLTALQSWAEAKAEAAIPGASPSIPVGTATFPDIPTFPVTVTGNVPGIVPVVAPLPVPPIPPGIPATASGSSPLPAVAPKSTTAAKGSSMAPIALGAVAGGLLFGLPGALIGAAGGAAVS